MGAFFATRRNQVIIGAVALALVLALLLGLAVRGPSNKVGLTTGSTAAASPTPSDSPSPSPLPVASPTPPAPTPSPVAAPTPTPTAVPSAAVPGSVGPVVSNAGHELNPPTGSPADRLGSGGPCENTWQTPGWTISPGDCGIFSVRNQDQVGSVAFVIEHQGSGAGTKRHVYLMTGEPWHVRLAAVDDSGTKYDGVSVKLAHIAGDAYPEVVVGFRINGTGHFLTYDIVQMAADGGLTVAASRNLDHGSANIDGNQVVDYAPYPNASTPEYFIRSVIRFSGGAFRIVESSHAPERGPGDLAPPP